MAVTGQTGTHAPQSMHSAGLMKSCFTDSCSGSSLRGWMQSTGQTSTQAVSFVPMQGSAITYAIHISFARTTDRGSFRQMEHPAEFSYTTPQPGPTSDWFDCTVQGHVSQLCGMRLEWSGMV